MMYAKRQGNEVGGDVRTGGQWKLGLVLNSLQKHLITVKISEHCKTSAAEPSEGAQPGSCASAAGGDGEKHRVRRERNVLLTWQAHTTSIHRAASAI